MRPIINLSLIALVSGLVATEARAVDCVFKYRVQYTPQQLHQLELADKPDDPQCDHCVINQGLLQSVRERWQPGATAPLEAGWAYLDGPELLSLTVDSDTCQPSASRPTTPTGPR